ncbi:uncharacterized protein LOC143238641 [Tachypleus tridentatus]|uniref:uncharacterized protein LOC143238641 n=1 Tax=Tachypleus tridentatus TaxID=6853 RepID=UPI003FD48104
MWIMWTAILLYKVVNGLRITYLDIPRSVRSGQDVRLHCMYDLEEDSLYSVKWYKDDLEFFRYVPKEIPQRQFFPLDGINIDFTHSSKDVVYIQDVQLSTGGKYRCEVSADAPSFRTVSTQKVMIVKVESGGTMQGRSDLETLVILILAALVFGIGIEYINLLVIIN